MGLFKTMKAMKDVVSSSNGIGDDALVGRALVVDASLAGNMAISVGVEQYRVCQLRLQVFLDGQQPYIAEAKQKVEEWRLAQLVGGSFAVRVERTDAQRVALDFSTPAPVVTLGRPADGGAQTVLATGRPAEAVIISNTALGIRNWEGNDLHLFQLTVLPQDAAPYQVQLGNPVPASALALLYPGSKVPVKVGAQPNDVVVDWQAALTAIAR